jgi:LEA14-like dessication related protein
LNRTLKYLGIGLVSICAIVIAAGFIFRKQIASRYIPEVKQVDVIHIRLNNDTSYVNFKLAVTNQSFLRIEIDTLTYKISLFNKTYLQKRHFLGIVLPGHGCDTLHVSIKIPYVAIFRDLAKERGKGDSTNYGVELFLQYSTVFGESEIAIHRAAKLKIPAVPEFEIVDVKWNRVRLKSILASVTLKLVNYSEITLSIQDLKYAMEFLEQGIISGVYKQAIIVKPKAETIVTIPIQIKPNRMIKTAMAVMTNNDKYDYTLKLAATLESLDSIKSRFQIELVKNGRMELKNSEKKKNK